MRARSCFLCVAVSRIAGFVALDDFTILLLIVIKFEDYGASELRKVGNSGYFPWKPKAAVAPHAGSGAPAAAIALAVALAVIGPVILAMVGRIGVRRVSSAMPDSDST